MTTRDDENNAVYLLKPIFDVPRFEGFASKMDRSSAQGNDYLSQDFKPRDPHTRDWKAPSLTSLWKPIEVVGRVRKFNDYPCVDASIPAFSERAVEVLRDFLEPNGELLPLSSSLGRYFAYNVTTVADVLDQTRSKINLMYESFIASRIDRYEFIASKLAGLSIFRIPEQYMAVYVTEAFAARVRDRGLHGLDMCKLWPLPSTARWRDIHKENQRRYSQEGLPPGKTVKGNSLVVLLQSPQAESSNEHKHRINELIDQLNAMLVEVDSTEQAVGNIEGLDREPDEYRLFLSCPDADKLAMTLLPWLRSLRWDGEVKAVKRYGEYVDATAREEYVDLKSSEPGKSVAVRETPLSDEMRQKIASRVEEAWTLLGVTPRTKAASIQDAIEAWIEDYRKQTHPSLAADDAAWLLGAFWGELLCRQCSWQWAMVNRYDQELCGVVARNRECVVFPIDQVLSLLTDREAAINTHDVFKMIKKGKFPPTKPKGYLILGTPTPATQPIVPP